MKLIDANILIYAYMPTVKQHPVAREWLGAALSGGEPVCFSWLTLMAFLRISTDSRMIQTPMLMDESCSIVSGWLAQPNSRILDPGERHWTILSKLLVETKARGPLAMDAHLAALAIEHGAVLVSADRDFRRFDGLQLLNPLEG